MPALLRPKRSVMGRKSTRTGRPTPLKFSISIAVISGAFDFGAESAGAGSAAGSPDDVLGVATPGALSRSSGVIWATSSTAA